MKLRWLIFEDSHGIQEAPVLQVYDEHFGLWEDVPIEVVKLKDQKKQEGK